MDIQDYIQSGVIESYVLGIASPHEVIEIERLKEHHTEIQEAIDDFAVSLEEQAFKNALVPPADIKEKLMSGLSAEFIRSTYNPLTVAYSSNESELKKMAPVKKLVAWRYVAAASIILLMASAVTNIFLYNKYSRANTDYQALLTERNSLQASNDVYQTKIREWRSAAEMMADPTMAMVKMHDPAKKANNMTTVFWDTKTKDVYLMANRLPAPQKDKQYQLWAIVNGKPVDAGMLDPNCTTVCKMKNMPRAQAFAITLEKVGGSPTPTMLQLFVLGNV